MARITKTIKHKLNLASTAPNCCIFNPSEYGFFHIWDRQLILHCTNWTHKIQKDNIGGTIA
jgi:hypothetical protein